MDAPCVRLCGEGSVVGAAYTLTGDRVATASDARVVQVWACAATEPEWDLLHAEELPGRAQPTQLAWAHPEHGAVLAVGTDAGTVLVLQGPSAGDDAWRLTATLDCGGGPISALAFAPRQHGLVLAAAAAARPGAAAAAQLAGMSAVVLWEAPPAAVGVLEWTQLGRIKVPADAGSCRCLCWREAAAGLPPLLALGHERGGGSVWAYQQRGMAWAVRGGARPATPPLPLPLPPSPPPRARSRSPRAAPAAPAPQEVCAFSPPHAAAGTPCAALHWAPALGRPSELLAAAFGALAVIYRLAPAGGDALGAAHGELGSLAAGVVCGCEHPAPVWQLEFNPMGNTLACSLDGAPEVWFWMPPLVEGPWSAVSKITGGGDAAMASDPPPRPPCPARRGAMVLEWLSLGASHPPAQEGGSGAATPPRSGTTTPPLRASTPPLQAIQYDPSLMYGGWGYRPTYGSSGWLPGLAAQATPPPAAPHQQQPQQQQPPQPHPPHPPAAGGGGGGGGGGGVPRFPRSKSEAVLSAAERSKAAPARPLPDRRASLGDLAGAAAAGSVSARVRPPLPPHAEAGAGAVAPAGSGWASRRVDSTGANIGLAAA
ncbi:seh1l [Scenedesmus sp. PABB004]|nr:seh1l [Scenedesmus sp. PABB004]